MYYKGLHEYSQVCLGHTHALQLLLASLCITDLKGTMKRHGYEMGTLIEEFNLHSCILTEEKDYVYSRSNYTDCQNYAPLKSRNPI